MNLAILVSGRGSNMNAIIEACEQGKLDASVELVISNNRNSDALVRAQQKNIDTLHISSATHPDPELLDEAMARYLVEHDVDLIVLAGYMKKIGEKVLAQFRGRVINIHPSLLPRHGGQGMFGMNVHSAVIAAGDKETGVTIHMVNGEYDDGVILAQRSIPVSPDADAESVARSVLEIEHELYPETIQKIIKGSIILSAD